MFGTLTQSELIRSDFEDICQDILLKPLYKLFVHSARSENVPELDIGFELVEKRSLNF